MPTLPTCESGRRASAGRAPADEAAGSGTHPRNYLPSLIADHYKHEDAGFDLWSAAGL